MVGTVEGGRFDSISGDFIPDDNPRPFYMAVDPDQMLEMTDADGRMLKNASLNRLIQAEVPGIVEGKIAGGTDALRIFDGADVEASIRGDLAVTPAPAPVPDEVAPAAAAPDGVDLRSPVLIEGIDMDGTKVDLVIHDVDTVDGKSFMSGTFTVETPTGMETREFVLPVDSEALRDLEGLSNADLEARLTGGGMDRFLDDPNHQMVLSSGESFPDRSRLMADIARLEDITGQGPHIGLMAIMGQQDPSFIENFDGYLRQSFDPDQAIKMAVMDAVGITDVDRRNTLLYGTGDLDDFAARIRPSVDLHHGGIMDTLNAMGDQVRNARIAADGADMARDAARVMDAAENASMLRHAVQAGKWGARVAGVGIAIGAASTAMAYEAKEAQFDLADMLAAQDPPVLSEEALAAYKEMAQDMFENTLVDIGVSTVDQFVVPSAIVSIGFEARASAAYQEWLDEYAPNLPPEYVDALSPTSFETKNAQMEMLDNAIEILPESKEGLPEGMHALIDASNAYRAAQQELVDMTLGKPHMSTEEMQAFMVQAGVRDQAMEALMDTMHECMRDPENIRSFLELLPEDDRLEFVRRLAGSEENMELMAALHPEVAEYVEAYENSGLGYYFVGLDEEEFLQEHMDLVTDYIMDRAGLIERPEPDLEDIRETIDQMLANGGVPEDAPPEFVALAELQGSPELQQEVFEGQVADGMVLVAQIYAEDNYVEPETAPDAALVVSNGYDQTPALMPMSPS